MGIVGYTRIVMTQAHRFILLLAVTTIFALSTAVQPAVSSGDETPTESVKRTISKLMRILGNQELNEPDRAEERLQQIERALSEHISPADMAKQSLGIPWNELNAAEQQEFTGLFMRFLAKSLAAWTLEQDPFADGGATETSVAPVTFLAEDRNDRLSEVRTRMRSYKVDTMVNFHLVNRSGRWRVYDITVDHTSIAGNYRSQFASFMNLLSFSDLEDKIKRILPILKLLELLGSPR
jgi:phospholipid transport system substrate-binding protein